MYKSAEYTLVNGICRDLLIENSQKNHKRQYSSTVHWLANRSDDGYNKLHPKCIFVIKWQILNIKKLI